MRKSYFDEAQIIGMIKVQDAGLPTVELCRRHGLQCSNLNDKRVASRSNALEGNGFPSGEDVN